MAVKVEAGRRRNGKGKATCPSKIAGKVMQVFSGSKVIPIK